MPEPNAFYSEFDIETIEPRQTRDYRTAFQVDRDRVIHTGAFRRLQNKTQVFVSGQFDFYRTRLTHSIEVAQIGRSICAFLHASSKLLRPDCFIDPDLVEAACLAHDIGHPPFGHTGERGLNRLMREHGGFEGNAQTLRLLTETIFSGQGAGMAPTRAFADAVLKYKTLRSEAGEAPENHFLYNDQDVVLDFVFAGIPFPEDLGAGEVRNRFRSIECQVMDWADDTAYSLNDIADGIRAGFVTLESLERWAADDSPGDADAERIADLCRAIRDGRVEARLARKIGDFIAACRLEERETFMTAATNRYRFQLVIDPDRRDEAALYKKIALQLVFRSPQLAQLDHKANFIITRLFDAFRDRYVERPPRSRFTLLPAAAAEAIEAASEPDMRARLVCDALAAMTDPFAIRTYRRLFDPDFGSIIDIV